MSLPDAMEDIHRKLEELRRLDSVSPFSRRYYDMIAERLGQVPATSPLRRIFGTFLARESRYHQGLRNLADAAGVKVGDAQSLADKRRIGLWDVTDLLSRVATQGEGEEVVRQLIAAETHYHLGRSEQVVARLEEAISLGAGDPLTSFALGYSRCMLAAEAFTALDGETGERIIIDPRRYRNALLEAVSSFEQGLTGGEFDGQLYRWIGTALEHAGFDDAAKDALKQAEEGPDASAETSEQDLRELGEFLKQRFTLAQILGKGEDDGGVPGL